MPQVKAKVQNIATTRRIAKKMAKKYAWEVTAEVMQDAIGWILTNTTTIDLTYNDGLNTMTADLNNTTVVPETYWDVENTPVLTIDATGRITTATVENGYIKKPVDGFFDPTLALPVWPNTWDRYISEATANGWIVQRIYEFNWLTWDETNGKWGDRVYVISEGTIRNFNWAMWIQNTLTWVIATPVWAVVPNFIGQFYITAAWLVFIANWATNVDRLELTVSP